MKKINARKLSITPDTIRILSDRQLGRAAGGQPDTDETWNCTTPCTLNSCPTEWFGCATHNPNTACV